MFNELLSLLRQCGAALRLLVVMTVLLGVLYPTGVWAVGRIWSDHAEGQPVRVDGRLVGSRLLGQEFTGDRWFHSRPSAADYDTLATAPSNLGPSNPDLLAAIAERRAEVARSEGVAPSRVPADALTGSGSGVDPQISPAYAALQVARVARVNGLAQEQVRRLVAAHTSGRQWGFLGEPGVNVLLLNVALQQASR